MSQSDSLGALGQIFTASASLVAHPSWGGPEAGVQSALPSTYPPALVPKQLKGLAAVGRTRPSPEDLGCPQPFLWPIRPLASKHFSHPFHFPGEKRKATLQMEAEITGPWEIRVSSAVLSGAVLPQLFASPTGERRSNKGI